MANSDNGDVNQSNLSGNDVDLNNSIFKKVTKRVSGFLPSSLSKWFGPTDEGQQSVIRRREEDEEESFQIQQPPKKRAKSSTDNYATANNNFTISYTPLSNSRDDPRYLPGPSGYSRNATVTSASMNLFDLVPCTSNTRITNGDDDRSDSGDSIKNVYFTPHVEIRKANFVSDRGNPQQQQEGSSMNVTFANKAVNTSPNSTPTTSLRSLFSNQSLIPQRPCLSSRRPSFSASTFGSPSFVDRTLTTKRAVNSPFYNGRTTFGGAAAFRRNRLIFPTDGANNLQARNSISIKPVNDSPPNTTNASLSQTARRILDALEQFSTPIVDAKKIPNINRQICDLSKTRQMPYTKESPNKSSGTKRELLVPTVSDLLKLKLKERLQDSTVKVREVATTSKSTLNTEYSIPTVLDLNKPQKHINKIKNKIVNTRGDKNKDLGDTIDTVKLPDVQLPITNLPKFDFTLPPPSTVTNINKPVEPSAQKNSEDITKSISPINFISNSTKPSLEFIFANPVTLSNTPKSVTTTINNFKFSEPIDAKLPETSSDMFKPSVGSTAPRRKEPTKNNGQNNVVYGIQPAAQLVSGSVMDILGKQNKKPEDKDDLLEKFKPEAGTWECSSCMVRNTSNVTRCIACEVLKEPQKKSETFNSITGFGNQFKMSSDKWECSACMVRNNQTDTKCVACTTPKPNSNSTSTTSPISKPNTNSLDGFGDKFKPASNTWECSTCMIRNKSEDSKCVACETPKPGTKIESKSSLIITLQPTKNSGFSDFIKKQQPQWECTSCLVRNSSEKTICMCCEALKPGTKQEYNFGTKNVTTPQFKFGIDKASSNDSNNLTPKSTPLTGGFKFNSDEKMDVPVTFSFGIKPATTVTDKASNSMVSEFSFSSQSSTKKNQEPETKSMQETATVNNNKNALTFTTNSKTINDAPIESKTDFKFGPPTTLPHTNLSFVAQKNSAITIASSITPTSNTTKNKVTTSRTSTNMFGNTFSSKPAVPDSVGTTTVIADSTSNVTKNATVLSTTINSGGVNTTFNFTIANNSNTLNFGGESKIPQFNFGSGGLPFSPSFNAATQSTATTTNSVSNVSTNATSTPIKFNSGNNSVNFPTTNSNSVIKPYTFGVANNSTEKLKSQFSFNTNDAKTPTQSKTPAFTFTKHISETPAAPQSNFFNFGSSKVETKTSFNELKSTGFTQQTQSSGPQNGGFNFGAPAAVPTFNFGAGASNNTTPEASVFGFGGSQAGTGSAGASAVPGGTTPSVAPGVFAFGAGTPQQNSTAFSPDIKPNFNFTGGALPTFTAQGSAAPGIISQRKIRKPIRRTQPR